MRIEQHPILGELKEKQEVDVFVDGKRIRALKGEMIAAALLANGIIVNRYTKKRNEKRSIFCGIGNCTDCVMIVNGVPNVRTCITPITEGMVIETQVGVGERLIHD